MHLRCPHCHNPIELADTHTGNEIACPACGSTFHLHEVGTTGRISAQRIGRFEVLDLVGQGAFGSVYKARDPELDRIVAVKVPRAASLPEAQDFTRFAREARSVAQLRHPAIVSIYEVGISDNAPFLVSEFIEGVTLADWLSAHRATPHEAARWCEELADALHYAHQHGVIHRDVKPSNVMLERTPPTAGTAPVYRLRVMDFGLARRDVGEVAMTIEGQILGTPAYMSPEQAAGEALRVDGRSDLYSVGVVLYQLLAGELPYRGTPRMLMHQVLHDEPRRPRSLNEHVPRDLETITLKAMAKEPARRYSTGQELADDLRRWIAGEPILARPVGWVEHVWRWARRKPAVASLLAALTIVLAVGIPALIISSWRTDLARRDADSAKEYATRGWETAERRLEDVTKASIEINNARERNRQILYGARANLVQMVWPTRSPDRVQQLLEEQKPGDNETDLRGFEWYYYRHLLDSRQMTLAGHTDTPTALAFSPEGRFLASASRDGTVILWELPTRQPVRQFPKHSSEVVGLVLSANASRLATVSRDKTVRVWDTASGKEAFAPLAEGTAESGAIDFSSDGKLLVVAGKQATIHDETGKQLVAFAGHEKAVTAVTFSPNGKLVASAGVDGNVRIWESFSGKQTRVGKIATRIREVAFSADGQTVIVTAPNGATALWRPETGQGGMIWTGYNQPGPSAFSRINGQLAYLSGPNVARVVDTGTGREVTALRGHSEPITALRYGPDGARIATASRDRMVKVWSLAFGLDVLEVPGHIDEVFAVVYSPDGKHLATAGADGTLRVREATTGQEVHLLRAHISDRIIARAPDQTHTLQGVSSLAYSRDGQRLVSGGANGDVAIWDVTTGTQLRQFNAHARPVTGLAFSSDGKRIASSSWDRTAKIWDVDSGNLIHTLRGHSLEVSRVAFSPDGQLVATSSWDQTIRLWDPATGNEVRAIKWVSKPGRVDPIESLAFHPKGKYLAAAPDPFGGDGEVKVFDLDTGATVHSLGGHIYGIFQVVFSADGRRLASCSCDGGLKVWDMATGHELFSFDNRTGLPAGAAGPIDSRRDALHSVAFSPDGMRLALGCRNSKVLVLDATPPTEQLLVAREAHRVVRRLFKDRGTRATVLEGLGQSDALSEPLRQEALARAKWYKQDVQARDDKSEK